MASAVQPPHLLDDAALIDLCRTGVPGYNPERERGTATLDLSRARRALGFFWDHLRLIEGEDAGKPFLLQPWQAAIVANLFGWIRADGTRRYRECFILVGRKNGKTPLAAGVALYMLLCDQEPGAQVYCAAAELQQAALLYRHAAGMVARSPVLEGRCRAYRAGKSIEVAATTSIFRALSADATTKHGMNVHAALVDEVHAHPNGDLVKVLTSGTSSRRQPLVLYITTADYERPSICNELHDYARKIRDGIVSAPQFLPVIYEAGATDDMTLVSTWRKANPNLGVSKKLAYMEEQCQKARDIPTHRNEFLRLDLNIRTGQQFALIDPVKWAACAGSLAYPDLRRSLVGEPCFGGLDLAVTTDLTAFALYFPRLHALLLWFWAPRENARERARKDRVPYIEWAEAGFLTLTEGSDGMVTDYDRVRADVVATCALYRPSVVNFDRYNSSQIIGQLRGDGIDMAPMAQGFISLSPPTKELIERLIPTGALVHGGHPILTWMAGHVQAEMDAAGNIKPSKAKSRERIDGIAASVMAIAASQVAPATEYIHPTVMHVTSEEDRKPDGASPTEAEPEVAPEFDEDEWPEED